ncbi:CBS domain-containing protein [Rhodococcus sp. IEGM 1354]|uniref:CBS domain-containing protein n=1 Tax=Rhodococcus sp. IEGM 1354 TaxID=3047088 RepID=UPI0024B8301C|nr:CBS domain-containing protein [Rhodococcus sp. IEGM 1354]MDI9933665.1 CBS domain-containing protein [Rhodococcus sp. IEGM 1354]
MNDHGTGAMAVEIGHESEDHQRSTDGTSESRDRVRDVMVKHPKMIGAATTLEQAAHHFADEHVHMLLVVEQSRLVGTLIRADLCEDLPPTSSAIMRSVLTGRCVRDDEPADAVLERMIRQGIRRLAVIDGTHQLAGLLCLKRSGRGFCSDTDVSSRH